MTQDIDVGKLAEQINDKADRDLWNTVPNVWNNTLNTSQITNCITEILQDIKLELNNGTLTLKAGSKVYVPNGKNADGSLKFDEVIIPSDISRTIVWNGLGFITCQSNNSIDWANINYCFSGDAAPDNPNNGWLWYDTANNIIKRYNGSEWTTQRSLPIAILNSSTTQSEQSIDQVFNGFGYIGSTIFALPGVKGLIPNGRNADGSLKNTEFATSKVLTFTVSGSSSVNLVINQNGYFISNDTFTYDSDVNFNYQNNNKIAYCDGGFISIANGVITSFTPKTAFHAVDRNDSSWLSGLGMPSNKNINLTLGASGSSYTAPANGYFVVVLNCGGKWANIYTSTDLYNAYGNNTYASANFPVKKGDNLIITYESGVTKNIFKFVYAEGDK